MIRRIVDLALNSRFLVVTVAVLLFFWGVVSFEKLPIEAYPDVANNYVQVITQWPGRAAEEVEQQVTIPLEIVMNGLPHLEHLRSTSLFGLSSLMLVFDDDSDNDWNRARVLERLSEVTLPPGLQPQMGTDWSPVGQIYWYSLHSDNPEYDLMELKALEDWTLEKQFKSVPNVVDVASFGGSTKEYQVRIDPDKLVDYGLSIGQVEQQLGNNNMNAGGSFIEQGLQQVNVRSVGLVDHVEDIGKIVLKTQNGTAIRVSGIATVEQGPKIRLGQIGKAIHRADGRVIDNDDVIEGIALLRKGADSDRVLQDIHTKVDELNSSILPPGVKVVPFLDRSDLVHYTTHTVLHNLTEGIILVAIVLFLFLGNARGALIVAMTIPFSLLFASICLDLRHIPANLLSLGALDFGMVVDGAVVMVENIVRHLGASAKRPSRPWSASARRRTRCSGRCSTPSASSSPPTCPSSPCRAWKGASSNRWRGRWPSRWPEPCSFPCVLAPVLSSFLFRRELREWHNPVLDVRDRALPRVAHAGPSSLVGPGGRGCAVGGGRPLTW